MVNVIQQIDAAFAYIIIVSLALLLFITVLMIYFLVRFRKKRNPVSSDIRGNTKIELAWMILPTLIALSMFHLGWQSFLGLRGVPAGALEIKVTGMQFAWVFNYPGGKESEGLLLVPEGRAVKLNITSIDVIHGFYIPAFRIKMDALPNMLTYAWFQAVHEGVYPILCTQFCGVGHADMSATLRIVSLQEYQTWLTKK